MSTNEDKKGKHKFCARNKTKPGITATSIKTGTVGAFNRQVIHEKDNYTFNCHEKDKLVQGHNMNDIDP